MLTLGIETSGLSGSVALSRAGQVLESRSLVQAGRRHAQSLVLEMKRLLADCAVSTKEIDAVAVSRGPGSFTGLRVGMVCAKTLAYTLNCRFVAVDTFVAVAMNCPPELRDLWIVEDAQRGDLFAGRYRYENEGWYQTEPIEIVPSETWLPQRTPEETVVGRGLLRCDLTLTTARTMAEDQFSQPVAAAIALAGERRLTSPRDLQDKDFDFWKAVPFYIRPSAAEEKLVSGHGLEQG